MNVLTKRWGISLALFVLVFALLASAVSATHDYTSSVPVIKTYEPYVSYTGKTNVYGYSGRADYSVNYNYYHNHYKDYPRASSRASYRWPQTAHAAYGRSGSSAYSNTLAYQTRYGYYADYGYRGYPGAARYLGYPALQVHPRW